MRFAIFRFHLSKLLRLPRKSDTRSYEVLHLSRKIIPANLKIWCSKMQPLSGNQRPDLLTSLMNMSLVSAPATENASLQILFKCPTPAIVFGMLQNLHVLLTFDKVQNPWRLPRETPLLNVQKCSVPLSFCTFDFGMCFAPQRRATFFDISPSKSGPQACVFCAFCLRNVLRATTACTFSTSNFSGPNLTCFVHFDLENLGNVLRATTACNFSSLIWPAGSAPAALASLLFDPPEPQIIGKTQCFATFLPFRAPGSSFFWDFLFFDLLSSSLLFSDSSHLCSSFVHIVGSLTSKLPSTIPNTETYCNRVQCRVR